MTTSLRLLSVVFDQEIRPEELECFRGAIADKVGLERDYYHNHNNAADGGPAYHYRYPLVQYQLLRRRPRLLFLNEAIKEARHFFAQNDWDLHLNGRIYRSGIAELKAGDQQIGFDPAGFRHYYLRRWQALNADNYREYLGLNTLRERVALLERVLVGQLLAFFKGVDHRLTKHFEVDLTASRHENAAHYKGVQVKTFDLSFRANLLLPTGVGLGKGASLGFGVLGREERGR